MYRSVNRGITSSSIESLTAELYLETPINSKVLFKLIENSPYIEKLQLHGKLSNFNLDSFSNLKELKLSYYTIMDDFNLEYISIYCSNLDDKCLENLFYNRNFSYLTTIIYYNY